MEDFIFKQKTVFFSASNWIEGKKDSKWEIKKSDKSLKDYMLSYISWRCEYKDAEKEYIRMLDIYKNEKSAKFFAEVHMNEVIEDNKKIPYWIQIQNKILDFFEETN